MNATQVQTASEMLVELRKIVDMSQYDLAEAAGLDRSMIEKLETGEVGEDGPSCRKSVQKISRALKLRKKISYEQIVEWVAAMGYIEEDIHNRICDMAKSFPDWIDIPVVGFFTADKKENKRMYALIKEAIYFSRRHGMI